MPETHVYVAVRSDLPFAHQAVQAVHAGIAVARDLIPAGIEHPSLVLVTVPDIPALLKLRNRCDAEGIDNRLFIEEDLGFTPTALATAPVNGKARKLFRELPLFTGAT